MKDNVRLQAALTLLQVLTEHKSLNATMNQNQQPLNTKDQALMQELCFGTCRYLHQLQFWVKQLLQRPLKTKDHDILALIYIGLYQLFFTRIPDHAAIGETVEVASLMGKHWAKGLVNGVLRSAQRQQNNPPSNWADDPIYQFSHPKWFIKTVSVAWPEMWQNLLQANNGKPPMTVRVNTRKLTRDDYLAQLKAAGLPAHPCAFSSTAITLEHAIDVSLLPGFSLGTVSVQDEAAQLAASLLDLQPQQRVLDACCAPGGKTGHLLETEPELAEVIALDSDEQRMTRVAQNLQRLSLKAMLKVGRAEQLDDWWDGRQFDRILLDAPCSATGVIRRHPDIKLLRRQSDIAPLAALQLKMITALWQTLAPGGKLVYATCSVLPQENEQVIEQFLSQHDNARHWVIDVKWGTTRPYGRQLFPVQNGHDGFYYACLVKL